MVHVLLVSLAVVAFGFFLRYKWMLEIKNRKEEKRTKRMAKVGIICSFC